MGGDEFPIGPAKAILTVVILVGLISFMIWDARRNPPE